jgi:hypothetical protein
MPGRCRDDAGFRGGELGERAGGKSASTEDAGAMLDGRPSPSVPGVRLTLAAC